MTGDTPARTRGSRRGESPTETSPAPGPAAHRGALGAADEELADRLAAAVLTDAAPADAVLTETGTHEPADHLALIDRCADAERITRELLRQAVDAARSAGHSWTAIGARLGMSRQAAQQRFGGAARDPESADQRWLGPVTAFDEMDELAIAGRLGWHTVEAGILRHRMVRTDTQWEHRRLLWPSSPKSLVRDGWQIGCRMFPWIYLIRDLGVPPEEEASPVAEAPSGLRDVGP